MSSSCSTRSKLWFHRSSRPPRSMKMSSFPFTMISVTSGSSTSSCKISRRRKLSNSLFFNSIRCPSGRYCRPACPTMAWSIQSYSSSSPICSKPESVSRTSPRSCSRRLCAQIRSPLISVPSQNLPDHSTKAAPDNFPGSGNELVPGDAKISVFPISRSAQTASDNLSSPPALR